MKKHIPALLKGLAAYQIFGGMLGIGLALRFLARYPAQQQWPYLLLAITALFYIFSIVAGAVLLRRQQKGLTLSLLNQVLQVVRVAVGGFAYNYVAGFKVGPDIYFAPVWQAKLNFSLSSFQLAVQEPTGRVVLGINLLALVLVYLIERLRG